MSDYNFTLQAHNYDLQSILDTINELPEAGSGGEQATPEISVSSDGLITATAGTKTSIHQLAFQPAKTITPSTASQIAVSSGYYTGGDIVVAAVPTATQATPTISVNSSGLITASATQTAGYVDAGTKSATKQLTTQGAQTITPGTSNKTIAGGRYLTGTQTIKGDSNLVAENIKSGVSIFGVTGTLESGGSSSSDEVVNLMQIIGNSAFNYCYNLTSVSFPACTSIGSFAFYCCYNLTTAIFPACISIGSSAFNHCSNLTSVSFPACASIGINAFGVCSKLTSVSFPACASIGSFAFNYCCNLKSLYLMGSSVCKLFNSNAFTSTPIGGYSGSAGTYGTIFVPASLLTSYQTATNWTYFSSRFVAYAGGEIEEDNIPEM